MTGFEENDILTSLNTIEFAMREFDASSNGISFLLSAYSTWNYDASPIDALKYNEIFSQLKSQLAKPESNLFHSMIQTYLLDNTHRVTVELYPSHTLAIEMIESEQQQISKFQKTLTSEELQSVIYASTELKKYQEKTESQNVIDLIPTLTLKDVKDTKPTEYPIEVEKGPSGVNIVKHELSTSTSDILYVDLGIDISNVPYEDIHLLPLFKDLLPHLDTESITNKELTQMIGMQTGGISTSLYIGAVNSGNDDQTVQLEENIATKFFVRGKATANISKIDTLFFLMNTLVTKSQLNNQEKALETIKKTLSAKKSSIQNSGGVYVRTLIQSHYSVIGFLNEKLKGLSSLKSLQNLLLEIENDWHSVLERLKNIQNVMITSITSQDGLIINLTGDKNVMISAEVCSAKFIAQSFRGSSQPGSKKGKSAHPWISRARLDMETLVAKNSLFAIPTQVSYVGKGSSIYEPGEKIHGSVSVITHFLQTGYLWEKVRVMGGAYGAFAIFSPKHGTILFSSDRDPNLEDTVDIFDEISNYLSKTALSELDSQVGNSLELQIIGTIGALDGRILSPSEQGWISMQRWLKDESAQQRRRWRDEIINTRIEDVIKFQEHLKKSWKKQSFMTIVSSRDKLESISAAMKVEVTYPI